MSNSKTSRSSKTNTPDNLMPTETNETPASPQIEAASPKPDKGGKAPAGPRLRLDDTGMQTSYANYANVTSTREETVLMFGMIQAYRQAQNEVPVQLHDRVVMSPFVARRLSKMLINLLQNYETQFGPLGDDNQ